MYGYIHPSKHKVEIDHDSDLKKNNKKQNKVRMLECQQGGARSTSSSTKQSECLQKRNMTEIYP